MSAAPTIAARTPPRPPARLTPPSATAEIDKSVKLLPTLGSAEPIKGGEQQPRHAGEQSRQTIGQETHPGDRHARGIGSPVVAADRHELIVVGKLLDREPEH